MSPERVRLGSAHRRTPWRGRRVALRAVRHGRQKDHRYKVLALTVAARVATAPRAEQPDAEAQAKEQAKAEARKGAEADAEAERAVAEAAERALAKEAVVQMEQEMATKLQAVARGRQARQVIMRERKVEQRLQMEEEMASKLQSVIRGRQARQVLMREREAEQFSAQTHLMALKLQCVLRGRITRRMVAELSVTQAAATKLQNRWRCKHASEQVKALHILVGQHEAARRVQAMFRAR